MTQAIKNEVKVEIAESLKHILADQHILYMKLRNYHWNIKGNQFYILHEKFEELYDELANDIDEIAERIRTLGSYSPGTMSEMINLAGLKEEKENNYPSQNKMVENIVNDLDFLIIRITDSASKIQNDFNDEVTAGLLYNLSEKYEKNNWMLKAYLG